MIASKGTLFSRDPRSFSENDMISKKNEKDLSALTEVSCRVDLSIQLPLRYWRGR